MGVPLCAQMHWLAQAWAEAARVEDQVSGAALREGGGGDSVAGI